MNGLSAFGANSFGAIGQESIASSASVSENQTTTTVLSSTVVLSADSAYTELVNVNTTANLVSAFSANALTEFVESVLSPDNQSTNANLSVSVIINPDTQVIDNAAVGTTGSVTSYVSLLGSTGYSESLLSPDNAETSGSLVVTVVGTLNNDIEDTPVGADNRQSSATLINYVQLQANTAVVDNHLSTTSGSLNALVNLVGTSQYTENLLVPDIKTTSGNLVLNVVGTFDTEVFEELSAGWGTPVTLFTEPREIKEISLSFDQLGRAVVFYRVGEDDLYLYWFNAMTQVNEIKYLGKGTNPIAGFDIIDDTSDPTSDVMLFYVRDDTVFMRIQREDYSIEYNTGVTKTGIRLSSSGIRIDNRFQVIYSYGGQPDLSITPENPGGVAQPNPEPPIEPTDPGLPENQTPIDGKWVYKNSGTHSGSFLVANSVKLNYAGTFKVGFQIDAIGAGQLYGTSGLDDPYNRWHHIFGLDTIADNSRHLQVSMNFRKNEKRARFLIWGGNSSNEYNIEIFNLPSVIGEWEFRFKNGLEIEIYFNGELRGSDWRSFAGYVSDKTRLTFGGYRWVATRNVNGSIVGDGSSFDGALSNCWLDHPDFGRIDWPITLADGSVQQSIPAGYPLEITNYRDKNWILIEE